MLGLSWQEWWQVITLTRTYALVRTGAELLLQLIPYVFLGIVVGAVLRVAVSPATIAAAVKRLRWWATPLAALLGLLSPFSTYTMIPVVAGLMGAGLPPGPGLALITASPLLNPTIFVMTAGALGWPLALVRAAAAWSIAFVAGLVAGAIWGSKARRQENPGLLSQSLAGAGAAGSGAKAMSGVLGARFWRELVGLGKFVGTSFFPAVFVAAATRVFLPAETLQRLFDYSPGINVLVAAFAGIPFYSCGGAAIPVAQVLLGAGLQPGAILSYLLAGPATNVTTLYMLARTFRWQMVGAYLLITLGGALAWGWLLDGRF